MNIVSQKPTFVNQLLYSYRNSIFATIRRFGVSRATIYRWRKRYNGTTQSLVEYSRRPHSHPNQQTKLMQRGYKRSIPALWRILRKLSLQPVKPPNPKYIPKPYEPMLYPGQRVQVDVKIVPNPVLSPMQTACRNAITNIRLLTNTLVFVSLWLLRNRAPILPFSLSML